MLYGLPHLDQKRFEVDFLEKCRSRTPLKILSNLLENDFKKRMRMNLKLYETWSNLSQLKRSEVIVSTVDSRGVPLAVLKSLGLLRTPVIHISQGLSDRLGELAHESWSYRVYRAVLRRIFHSLDRVLVLGEGARHHVIRTFDLDPEKVFLLPFGVDTRFWTPETPRVEEDFILSVGSDLPRDYPTLIEASRGFHLRIVTRLALNISTLHHHVEVKPDYSPIELRDLYRRARFVVTPLKDVTQPSGQSASLQAMACGKAVVLSRIRGLWEPSILRHGENCYLVEPGDRDGLRESIEFLYDNPDQCHRVGMNARRMVEEIYSSQRFASRLEEHIETVLRT